MSDCRLSIVSARVEPHAAAPTLTFTLRVDVGDAAPVHAVALRCQLQIEAGARRYGPGEGDRLHDLFGEPARWHDTMRPLLWTHLSVLIPRFERTIDVDVPVACSYDLEVVAAKYFHALDNGEIPLLFLFSGTIFFAADQRFSVSPIPWDTEAAYRLPVALWRELMDRYFPDCTWLRLSRENLDALHRFKGRQGLPTFDAAVEALLARVDVQEPA
jgi:Family of unknown function (DUF6084)